MWPPPEELHEGPKPQRGNSSGYPSDGPYPQSGPFFDPFFNSPPFTSPFARHRSSSGFAFRDPFELFDAIFADMRREFDAFDPHPRGSLFNRPNAQSNFSGFPPSFMTPSFFPGPALLEDDYWGNNPSRSSTRSYSFRSSSGDNGQQPRWASETTMVQTINGVTQTIHKKTDNMVSFS